jgi:hypothetical protein
MYTQFEPSHFYYLFPLTPPSPRREGGNKNIYSFLAPPYWGRGWGEVDLNAVGSIQ